MENYIQRKAADSVCYPLMWCLLVAYGLGLLQTWFLPDVQPVAGMFLRHTLSHGTAVFAASRTVAAVSVIPSAPTKKSRLRTAGVFFAALGVVIAVDTVMQRLFEAAGLAGEQIGMPAWPQEPWLQGLFVFAAVVTAPLLEELLYRRYVLAALLPLGRGWAMLISGALFAIGHDVVVWPGTALMGMLLAWLALETGSLLPGMALHCLNNGLAVLQLARPEAGEMVSAAIIGGMFLIGIVLLACGWEKRPKREAGTPCPWGVFKCLPFAAYVAICAVTAISNLVVKS